MTARAIEIVLKDGRVLRGKARQGRQPGRAAPVPQRRQQRCVSKAFILLDDDLRRTFFSDRLVREVRQEENRQLDEKFTIRQRVAQAVLAIKIVGQPLAIQPFDEFGRRIFTMATGQGPVDVIQGITELTPQWTKVEGISHVWDMRMATSSIPRDILQKILLKQIDPKDIEQYKKIARFYLQCERYEEARAVLDSLVTAFPDQPDLKEQLAPSLRAIAQLSAQRLLGGIEAAARRRSTPAWWPALLKRFPSEGVGGEILQGVREMIQEYETREARRQDVVKQLKALAARIPDTIQRENLKPILDEMAAEIGPNTLDRMAAFLQNADDPQTPDSEKLALAISGWLLGADAATEKLATAISAYKVRGLIREYLNETAAADRERIVRLHQARVGRTTGDGGRAAGPHEAALAIRPSPSPKSRATTRSKCRALAKEPPVTYYVQLPPEYDPYRRYPAIVTLNGDHHRRAADRLVGRATGQGRRPHRPGRAPRLHRDRPGVDRRAPEAVRLLGPRTRRRAQLAPRRLPAVLDRHRPRVPLGPFDGRRRGLGHRPGASRSLGGRDSRSWPSPTATAPSIGKTPATCRSTSSPASWTAAKLTKNARDLDRYLRRGFNATVVEYLGPRTRGLLRRDFADFRLDGPLPPQFLSARVRLRDACAPGTIISGGSRSRACRRDRWSIRPTGRRPAARSRCKSRPRSTTRTASRSARAPAR